MRKILLFFVCTLLCVSGLYAQTAYTTQTGNMNATVVRDNTNSSGLGSFAGTYNNGSTELAQYANQNNNTALNPMAVAYRTFTIDGTNSGATARTLRPGDRFTITCFTNTPANLSNIGICFKNNTTFTNATDYNNGEVCRFEIDGNGQWSIYSGGGAKNTNTSATSGSDRTLVIDITSSNTFNATIAGTTYFNLTFTNTGPIASFAIYNMVTGNSANRSNPNSFWKNASLQGMGTISLGGSSSTTITGNLTDGGSATSTSTSTTNLSMSGTSTITLTPASANTYSGTTTISSGTLQLGSANALPTTSNLTLSGGTLSTGNTTGFNQTLGTLTMSSSSTINLGSGSHTLAFNASNTISWTGTLTVSGWSNTGGKITFGNSNSGLTSTQLNSINFTGFGTGARITSTGEIVPASYFYSNAATGDFTTAASWYGGAIPTANSFVTIQSGHNITLNTSITLSSLTVNSGGTFTATDNTDRTLTIASNTSATSLTNNGTWNQGNAILTLAFTGAPSGSDAVHTIGGSQPIVFRLITIGRSSGTANVGVVFASVHSLASAGKITINNGGYIFSNANTSFYTQNGNTTLEFNNSGGYTVTSSDATWPSTNSPASINILQGTVTLGFPRTASGNLLISGGALTLAADLTINGNWTRASGATFTPSTYKVTLSGSTQQTITISGGGTASMYNLEINNAAGVTLANALPDTTNFAITNTLTLTNGALTIPSGRRLTLSSGVNITRTAGSISNSGNVIFSGAASSLTYNGTSVTQTTGAEYPSSAGVSSLSFNQTGTVTLSAGITATGSLTIGSGATVADGGNTLIVNGNISNSGTHTGAGKIQISKSSDVTLSGSGGKYSNLESAITGANLVVSTSTEVTGNLTITSGGVRGNNSTITMSGNSGTLSNSGTFYGEFGGQTISFIFSGTTTLAGSTGNVDAKNFTVNSGATLICGTQSISTNSTSPARGTVTINGTLRTANANGLWDGSSNNPTIRFSAGNFNSISLGSSSTIEYNASSGNQTLSPLSGGTISSSYANLTVNLNAGNLTMTADATVTGTLTFTKGNINTSTNKIIVSSTGSVSGASSSTGYVNGNLQKNVATGTSVTRAFEVGDASNYTPVSLTFANVTGAGNLIVATNNSQSSIGGYASYRLSKSKYINRFWTITANSAPTLSGTYTATLNFVSGDNTGSASTSALLAGVYNGSAWSYPSMGTLSATSSVVNGLSGFGTSLTLSECGNTVFTVTGGGSYCSGGSGVAVGLSGSQSGVNYQLKIAGTNTGSAVAGTGSAISFGSQTSAGAITVVATDGTTGCTSNMTSSASVTINANPTVFTVTGGGSYCSGGSGVAVGLNGSQNGVSYQLKIAGTNSGSAEAGTGSAISFGSQTSAGAITVVATDGTSGCTSNMTSSASVTINSLPTVSFTSSPGANTCGGTQVIYTTQASQTNYSWSVSGTQNTDYVITAGSTGSSSNSVTLVWLTSGPKSVSVNYTNSNGCSAASATSSTTTVTLTSWTGNAGDNLWNTSGNWTCGIPGAYDNISIPGSAAITVNGTAATVKNLTLASGASVTLGSAGMTVGGTLSLNGSANLAVGGNTLTLSGAVSGSGTLEGNGSSNLSLGSGVSGTLYFHATNNEFNTITGNSSFTLGSAVGVRGILKMNSGTLTTGGNLSLLSASGYTGIYDYSGAGSVSGNVTVQRYLSGTNDRWRGFSAPVSTTYSDISSSINVGVQGSNGANLVTLREMNTWNSQTQTWVTASNWRIAADTTINATTNGSIPAGRGFLAYVGTSGIATTTPTTLDLSGSLNQSDVTPSFLVNSTNYFGGWMLLGNPFASYYDLSAAYAGGDFGNIQNTAYVFSPANNGFISYNLSTGISSPSTANIEKVAPFQAFLIKASGATTATVTLKKSRTTTSAGSYNLRQSQTLPLIRMSVSKLNRFAAEAVVGLNSNATDQLDTDFDVQMPSSFNGTSLYTKVQGYKLTINSMPDQAGGRSIPVYFESADNNAYFSLNFGLENIDPAASVWMEDLVTNAWYNLRSGAVTFMHQTSNRTDRFVLHINARTTGVSQVSEDKINIWNVGSEVNVDFPVLKGKAQIEVMDMSGRVVYRSSEVAIGNRVQFQLPEAASGSYVVRVSAEEVVKTARILLTR